MTAKIQAAKVAKNESTRFFKLYIRQDYLEAASPLKLGSYPIPSHIPLLLKGVPSNIGTDSRIRKVVPFPNSDCLTKIFPPW
jgi:hypothetical protein